MRQTAPGDHTRVNGGLTARAEKRLLVWLARRVPAWIQPDHLTLAGLLGMLLAGGCFVAARYHSLALLGAVAALGLNWLGDSLDGTLARVRGRPRPRYGYYVDHVVDVLGSAALLAGLGASGFMSPAVAALLLLVYLMVSAEAFLATHALGVFRMSFAGFGPTELRLVLAAGAMRLLVSPQVTIAGRSVRLFDAGGVIAIAALTVALVVSIARNTRALSSAEPG